MDYKCDPEQKFTEPFVLCARKKFEVKYRGLVIYDVKVSVCFFNLHSLPFLPLFSLECKFSNKTGTEPINNSTPVVAFNFFATFTVVDVVVVQKWHSI